MALQKDSARLLRRALKVIHTAHNDWISTGELAGHVGVTPAKIRGLLEWHIANEEDDIQWDKPSSRVVRWRSTKWPAYVHAEDGQDKQLKLPDGGLIDGIAEVLGNKEKYRQALLKIRQVIDDALGDVISH